MLHAIVVAGAPQLLDQIYHEDKGYNRNHTVILADQAPDQDVKHALYRHDAASKVSYLQGSPFQTEVRWSIGC